MWVSSIFITHVYFTEFVWMADVRRFDVTTYDTQITLVGRGGGFRKLLKMVVGRNKRVWSKQPTCQYCVYTFYRNRI